MASIPPHLSADEFTPPLAQTLAAPGQRKRVVTLALLAIVFLVIVGVWTNHAVHEYLYNSLRADLNERLNANVSTLLMWHRSAATEARAWAAATQIRNSVTALAEIGHATGAPRAELMASPSLKAIREYIGPSMHQLGDEGFVIVNPAGLILASSMDRLVGRRASPFAMGLLAGCFDGEATVTLPVLLRKIVQGAPELAEDAVILSAAPVHNTDDQERVDAVLVFRLDPEDSIAQRLSVADAGAHGDTYAFDANGVMVTNSCYERQLKEIGLIPDRPDSRAALVVQIRDPGGDLTRGHQTDTPLAARPLTRMAASAVTGESGTDVKGYRDYRGVMVVGAWRWVPEFEIGVATEVRVEEAFGVLRPLKLAFWALFTLLAAATGVLIFSSYSIRRLQRRIDKVRQLGQYTLQEKIGQGGMGTVYKARHALLRRPTAVKLLNMDAATPEAIARFEREVQLTSQLTHPNTIDIYDFGRTPEGIFYYAMEYLPGVTLARLVELEHVVPPARVIYILRQVCASLGEAHAKGLLHRDIKPLNIILCERGGEADFVKVLDFGLVKDVVDPDAAKITMPQLVSGTPLYIAPERLSDPDNNDPRSDLYAIGVVAFNLLTGDETFSGRSALEQCHQVMHSSPPRPSERTDQPIPPALDDLVFSCLARDPAERPPNVQALRERLGEIELPEEWGPNAARRWWTENADRIAPQRAGEVEGSKEGRTPTDSMMTVDFDRLR